MRATKKRAVWMTNLHSAKVTYQGVRKTLRLCTKCLRRVKAQMQKKVSEKRIIIEKSPEVVVPIVF